MPLGAEGMGLPRAQRGHRWCAGLRGAGVLREVGSCTTSVVSNQLKKKARLQTTLVSLTEMVASGTLVQRH